MPRALHGLLHAKLSSVPVPSPQATSYVLEELDKRLAEGELTLADNLECRLGVLVALFEEKDEEIADVLRLQLQITREYNKGPH